jgi:hypothetical protein
MEELEQAAQDHHVKFWFSEPSPSASFISGAEWAQERLFTEGDMFKYSMQVLNCHMSNRIHLTPKEWKESLK